MSNKSQKHAFCLTGALQTTFVSLTTPRSTCCSKNESHVSCRKADGGTKRRRVKMASRRQRNTTFFNKAHNKYSVKLYSLTLYYRTNRICWAVVAQNSTEFDKKSISTPAFSRDIARFTGGYRGGVEMIFTINFNHIWTQQHHIWSKLIVNMLSTPPLYPPVRL